MNDAMAGNLVSLARAYLWVREVGGPNRGPMVEAFQRFTGNVPGDSWCASAVSYWLAMIYEGHSPLPATASCDELLGAAKAKGMVVDTPQVGDLLLVLRSPTDAHHVGIVTGVPGTALITYISGNTSADGASSNGDRVAEHSRAIVPGRQAFVRLP